jgi:hypothetical protein
MSAPSVLVFAQVWIVCSRASTIASEISTSTGSQWQRFCVGQGGWRALRRANLSEGRKERSPQQLAKSRRDYLARVKMLTVDERTQEAAKINKALGIEAPKSTAAAATLDAARAAYIRLLGSLGSNAEVKAEVTCFSQQLDQMQLRMLDPKPRKRPTTSSPSTYAR